MKLFRGLLFLAFLTLSLSFSATSFADTLLLDCRGLPFRDIFNLQVSLGDRGNYTMTIWDMRKNTTTQDLDPAQWAAQSIKLAPKDVLAFTKLEKFSDGQWYITILGLSSGIYSTTCVQTGN